MNFGDELRAKKNKAESNETEMPHEVRAEIDAFLESFKDECRQKADEGMKNHTNFFDTTSIKWEDAEEVRSHITNLLKDDGISDPIVTVDHKPPTGEINERPKFSIKVTVTF